MATPMLEAMRRWASRVEFSAMTAKTTSPRLRRLSPSLRGMSLHRGGKMEETRTRFSAAMPASRRASSKLVRRSLCLPTPLVKKRRVGTMFMPNGKTLRGRCGDAALGGDSAAAVAWNVSKLSQRSGGVGHGGVAMEKNAGDWRRELEALRRAGVAGWGGRRRAEGGDLRGWRQKRCKNAIKMVRHRDQSGWNLLFFKTRTVILWSLDSPATMWGRVCYRCRAIRRPTL